MIVNKAFRYRIYPDNKQINQINQNFGNARFVYNHFLDLKDKTYKETKQSISLAKTQSLMTELKQSEEYNWLNKSDSMSLQESLKDLDKAYKNFFKGAGFPKFKKKLDKQSYRTRNQNNGIRIIDDTHINLPILKSVKIKLSRIPEGRILNATLSKTKTNKYFVCLCVECDLSPKENKGNSIGVDLGIKDFCILSTGEKIANPKYLSKYQNKLKKEQRKLSHMIESHIVDYKVIGSKRYPIYDKPLSECTNINKQRIKLAKIHENITNTRNDFLHKLSSRLVKENQFICLEDLNVKGIVKNHNLAKSISEVSWSEFVRLLKYKSFEHGTAIRHVDRFYPSSKTCHVCGYKKIDLKLNEREWVCPNCNTYLDRDINASINILNEGLRLASL